MDNLPPLILQTIAEHLTFADVTRLRLTCRAMHNVLRKQLFCDADEATLARAGHVTREFFADMQPSHVRERLLPIVEHVETTEVFCFLDWGICPGGSFGVCLDVMVFVRTKIGLLHLVYLDCSLCDATGVNRRFAAEMVEKSTRAFVKSQVHVMMQANLGYDVENIMNYVLTRQKHAVSIVSNRENALGIFTSPSEWLNIQKYFKTRGFSWCAVSPSLVSAVEAARKQHKRSHVLHSVSRLEEGLAYAQFYSTQVVWGFVKILTVKPPGI